MTLAPQQSAELIAAAQTATWAIPASTGHAGYQYGWLRDGSYWRRKWGPTATPLLWSPATNVAADALTRRQK